MPLLPCRTILCGFLALGASAAVAQEKFPALPAPVVSADIPSRPLLMEPAIQREIGLTEKQKTNLAMIEEEYSGTRQAAVADPGEDGFDFNTMMGDMEDLGKQQRAATAKVLTSAQKNRLQQIEWQRDGWIALGRSDVATKLNLKNPQVQKIRAIITAMRENRSKVVFAVPDAVAKAQQAPRPKPNLNPANGFQGNLDEMLPGGGPLNFTADQFQTQTTKTVEATARILEDSSKEVDAVLTGEQKAAFIRLLGNPFDFKSLTAPQPPEASRPASKKRGGASKPAGKAK